MYISDCNLLVPCRIDISYFGPQRPVHFYVSFDPSLCLRGAIPSGLSLPSLLSSLTTVPSQGPSPFTSIREMSHFYPPFTASPQDICIAGQASTHLKPRWSVSPQVVQKTSRCPYQLTHTTSIKLPTVPIPNSHRPHTTPYSTLFLTSVINHTSIQHPALISLSNQTYTKDTVSDVYFSSCIFSNRRCTLPSTSNETNHTCPLVQGNTQNVIDR